MPHPLEVGVLPQQLKALHLGDLVGPPQPHVFPSSLQFLSFGDGFDQPSSLVSSPPPWWSST